MCFVVLSLSLSLTLFLSFSLSNDFAVTCCTTVELNANQNVTNYTSQNARGQTLTSRLLGNVVFHTHIKTLTCCLLPPLPSPLPFLSLQILIKFHTQISLSSLLRCTSCSLTVPLLLHFLFSSHSLSFSTIFFPSSYPWRTRPPFCPG